MIWQGHTSYNTCYNKWIIRTEASLAISNKSLVARACEWAHSVLARGVGVTVGLSLWTLVNIWKERKPEILFTSCSDTVTIACLIYSQSTN